MATITRKTITEQATMGELITTLRLTDDCELSLTTPNGTHVRMPAGEWNSFLDTARDGFMAQVPKAPAPAQPPKKCIVKGCTNHSDEGKFVGNLCGPCHKMLIAGAIGSGGTFIHELRDRLHKIGKLAF